MNTKNILSAIKTVLIVSCFILVSQVHSARYDWKNGGGVTSADVGWESGGVTNWQSNTLPNVSGDSLYVWLRTPIINFEKDYSLVRTGGDTAFSYSGAYYAGASDDCYITGYAGEDNPTSKLTLSASRANFLEAGRTDLTLSINLGFELPVIAKSGDSWAILTWTSTGLLSFQDFTLDKTADAGALATISMVSGNRSTDANIVGGFESRMTIDILRGASDSNLHIQGTWNYTDTANRYRIDLTLGSTTDAAGGYTGTLNVFGTLRLTQPLNPSIPAIILSNGTIAGSGRLYIRPSACNASGQFSHPITVNGYRSASVIGTDVEGSVALTSSLALSGGGRFHFMAEKENSTFTQTGAINFAGSEGGDMGVRVIGDGTVIWMSNLATGGANSPEFHIARGDVTSMQWTVDQNANKWSTTFGGESTIAMPTKIYSKGGLTNAYGQLIFNGGLDLTNMLLPDAAEGYERPFKFELADANYRSILASAITFGASQVLDWKYFAFTYAGLLAAEEYTLFTLTGVSSFSSSVIDSTPFLVGTDYLGQLGLSSDSKSIIINLTTIPEPAALGLLGLALGVVALLRRRK